MRNLFVIIVVLASMTPGCGGKDSVPSGEATTWYIRDAEAVEALLGRKDSKTLKQARELRAKLRKVPASEGSGALGQALGIARYAEFTMLVETGAEDEAYAVLLSSEPHTVLLGPERSAWMHERGANLALSLRKPPEDVVEHAAKCVAMSAPTGSTPAQCSQTACALLQTMGRADLNTDFAWRLFDTGRGSDDFGMMELGASFLADNYEAKNQKAVQAKLIEVRDVLEAEAPSAEVLNRVKEALFGAPR